MRLILWGMFKKVVVADSCAPYVDMCFDNPEAFSGATLILGAILFSFQIYGDFSGYSDIAIGTAKLFGFELMTNFKFPYFSRDIAEFWRRWHISLSTWFRDYLYIPLGGSASPNPRPSATYPSSSSSPGSGTRPTGSSSYGAESTPCSSSHYSCAEPTAKTQPAPSPKAKWLPSPRELLQMGWTFTAVTIAWVFFQADNIGLASQYLTQWLEPSDDVPSSQMLLCTMGPLAAVAGDWFLRENKLYSQRKWLRWGVYVAIAACILFSWDDASKQFIYFQF